MEKIPKVWVLVVTLSCLAVATRLTVEARPVGRGKTTSVYNITQCNADGNLGQCMSVSTCQGLPDFQAVPGYCPQLPQEVECCVLIPNTSMNPPVPLGWALMQQAAVTSQMTQFAVALLNDPESLPMFSQLVEFFVYPNTTTIVPVLGRVEWHPPDFNNEVVHRGVTLYQETTMC